MKLYFHLAWDGIRKNRRLYVPYLLTGVGAAAPAASLASLIVGIWFLLSGRWKTNNTGIRRAQSA